MFVLERRLKVMRVKRMKKKYNKKLKKKKKKKNAFYSESETGKK